MSLNESSESQDAALDILEGHRGTKSPLESTQSQRAHKRLRMLMRLGGLTRIDPETPEGRVLRKRANKYEAIRNPDLPVEMASQLIQLAVEAEILKDAAFTWMTKLRPPRDYADARSFAHRQAYTTAASTHRGYTQLLLSIMKILRGDTIERRELNDLDKELEKMRRVVDVPQKTA